MNIGKKQIEIKRPAAAGTLESSDVLVTIEPSNTFTIDLESIVQERFGDAIIKTAADFLDELGVGPAKITLIDKGALDCVIRARIETAVLRASKQESKP